MKIKKYNNNKNISGSIIRNKREALGINGVELCKRLALVGISLGNEELCRIEKNQLMLKDFELVAIFEILDMDLNILKDIIKSR